MDEMTTKAPVIEADGFKLRPMRQADAGDWTGLLARVAAALADHRG